MASSSSQNKSGDHKVDSCTRRRDNNTTLPADITAAGLIFEFDRRDLIGTIWQWKKSILSRWKIPENTVWSAKIKRSGFLPTPESKILRGCWMQKIVALNFCTPELSIY
ncbi:hypothetical protein QUF90_20300 [Desulfococcaceae bacterium HSG9]|nr:hypothetical protein [Desulfococcaceae bacterium HSG9]